MSFWEQLTSASASHMKDGDILEYAFLHWEYLLPLHHRSAVFPTKINVVPTAGFILGTQQTPA
jgi:hypothetical protein